MWLTCKNQSSKPTQCLRLLLKLILCLSVSLTFFSGCTPAIEEPVIPELVLKPTLIHSATLSGWAWTNNPLQAISPDGSYILLAHNDTDSARLTAYPLPKVSPLDGGQAGESESELEPEPIVLRTIDRQSAIDRGLEYIPIGWLSNTECLFISSGLQNRGKHRNRQGLSILVGDISNKYVNELAFIPLEYAIVRNAALNAEHNRLILDASDSIFTVDLESCIVKNVKQNPPTFQGSLAAQLSPDKTTYVYNLYEYEQDKYGVYLLDLDTGEEIPLIPNSDTMSFYPDWSPNGKYIATYTAGRKPDTEPTGIAPKNYEFYLGEDSPMPFGDSIRITDVSGQLVNEFSITGRILGRFKWSPDSQYIGFVSCPKPDTDKGQSSSDTDDTDNWEIPSLRADSMWIADITTGAIVRVADLSSLTAGKAENVYPLVFDAQSRGIFYQIIGSQSESYSIWYGAHGQVQPGQTTPAKVSDGLWYEDKGLPLFDKTTAALVGNSQETDTNLSQVSLWLLDERGFRQTSKWQAVTAKFLGYNEDTLVVYSYLGNDQFSISAYSMYSVADNTQ